MKLILLQNVPNLGKKNEMVEVKNGYARNYLLPRNMGTPATAKSLKTLEAARSKEAGKMEKLQQEAETLREKINGAKLEITKMTEGTRLFGSVGEKELRTMLSEAIGYPVSAGMIQLKNPIKEIGTYTLTVQLTETVHGKFVLHVRKEK